METWTWRFFLTGFCCCLSFSVSAQEQPDILSPDEDRVILRESDINAMDFEIGIYAGVLSVQDFGSNSVIGARFAYNLSEDFYLEIHGGESKLGKTSFEKLNKGFTLLSDSQRDYTYYNFCVGYNLFQGESFFGDSLAFNSSFYLLAGIGATEFADDKHHTLAWGFGYRIVVLDWLAVNLDGRSYMFESDIFAEDETFTNLAMHTGLTFFF